MATSVTGFRVFIASPGGLDPEREAVRDAIDDFNHQFLHETGTAFTAEGWEQVPGGRRRPQDLINEHLITCDYMVLLLANRWGSQPSVDGSYSSGTEEEFYTAEALIDSPLAPMTDILILFKGVPDAQLNDPGDQLKKVLKFKLKLETSKSHLYKTFDDIAELKQEISSRLLAWARVTNSDALTEAQPAQVEKGPPTGPTEATPATPNSMSPLAVAEAFAKDGLNTQAEAAFAAATTNGDVDSLESYARFLRQTGRAAKSQEINRMILEQLAKTEQPQKAAAQRAKILTNIGVTERKQGDLRSSRYTLTEAVRTAEGAGAEGYDALSYALDNLGITCVRAGDSDQGMNYYKRALEVRGLANDSAGEGRSWVNIARLHKRLGDLEDAKAACEAAISLLQGADDESAHATASATLGEIFEATGDLSEAEAAYRKALAINEKAGRPDNIALSLIQVARILLNKGSLVEAERFAKRALEDNEASSNREGIVASRLLLGRVLGATGREAVAVSLFEDALAAYSEMGNPTGEGWSSYYLSEVLARQGDEASARERLRHAGDLADSVGNSQLRSVVDLAAGGSSRTT